MDLLIGAGADPSFGRGRFLWQALRDDDSTTVELLVASGATLDLAFAAALNRVAAMQSFLGADGHLTEDAGGLFRPDPLKENRQWTEQEILNDALSYAAYSGSLDAGQWLLEHGADVSVRAPPFRDWDHGCTALHKACWKGHLEMVRLLLEAGADPRVTDARWNDTPVNWADSDEIKELLQAKLQEYEENESE